ncbi:prevent-host-death protein [Propionibacteriaceae bacterium Y2011]|uniref:prevent-host-death protein n=1 Tax=Microlunatus sp. Y2014 TaxID=3418488 RepID=UPI003B4EB3E6
MSGSRATFIGDAMASVVQGIVEVRALTGHPPVIVGGLAVLARLSSPYRATVDLDVVDRLLGSEPQLEVLRAADGAEPVEPAAVLLPTPYGSVRIDVLEVRQAELDRPSDDPGDRLHASSHAWANDSATEMTIEVAGMHGGGRLEVTTPVAEPGPLVATKLQAVMNRSVHKQGTDLQDVLRLAFDEATRPAALRQIGQVDAAMAQDIALHVDLWFVRQRTQTLRWIHATGGQGVTDDDLDLVAELLLSAARR